MSKEKKNVGRNRKYSDKELRDMIDAYIDAHPFIVKLQFTKIAEYANKHLNLEQEVSYQDFRRNDVIKNEIDGFNNTNTQSKLKNTEGTSVKIVRLNVENFVKKYSNNPNMQKVLLHKFNQKYEDAFIELSKKEKKEQEYKEKILELESLNKKLTKENTSLSVENRNLRSLNAKLNKKLDFRLNLDLYEDLISRKIVSSIDAENIKILLANAGLIKAKEMVEKEEIDTCFTEEILIDIKDNNRKVMDESAYTGYEDEELEDEEVFEDTNSIGKNKDVISMIDFFNNRK